MSASYCWGDRHIPHRLLSETSEHVTVAIDDAGIAREIPQTKVRGRVQTGDRVRELRSGGNWKNGTVLDGNELTVRFDDGQVRKIENARYIEKSMQLELDLVPVTIEQPIPEIVPMPELDDALDGELTLAMESVQPLTEGDRVCIVMAGPPLECLVGLTGTVEGPETFGLFPVLVEGHGSKILRREQLDLIVMDEPKPDVFGSAAPPETAEIIEASLPSFLIDGKIPRSGNFANKQVRHQKYWPNAVGKVMEMRQHWGEAFALVDFGIGPAYPALLKDLEIYES